MRKSISVVGDCYSEKVILSMWVMSLLCFNVYFFVEGCRTLKRCPKYFVTQVKSKKKMSSRKQWVCFLYNIYHNAYAVNSVDIWKTCKILGVCNTRHDVRQRKICSPSTSLSVWSISLIHGTTWWKKSKNRFFPCMIHEWSKVPTFKR